MLTLLDVAAQVSSTRLSRPAAWRSGSMSATCVLSSTWDCRPPSLIMSRTSAEEVSLSLMLLAVLRLLCHCCHADVDVLLVDFVMLLSQGAARSLRNALRFMT